MLRVTKRCIYCFAPGLSNDFSDIEGLASEEYLEKLEAHKLCAAVREGQPLAPDVLAARRAMALRLEQAIHSERQEVLLAAILGELLELRVQGERQRQ